jgi:hypothetical protein
MNDTADYRYFRGCRGPTPRLASKKSSVSIAGRGGMKRALIIAAVGEGITGLALLLAPSLVGELLLGEPLVGLAAAAARIAGLALIGLGLACWPGPPSLGMLAYSASVALVLGYLGLSAGMRGVLLWPAVAAHAALSAFLLAGLKRTS